MLIVLRRVLITCKVSAEMSNRRTLFRMLTIQRVLVKYGLDDVIKETHLLRPLRYFFYLVPRRRDRSAPLGERIRTTSRSAGVRTL